MRVSRNNFQIVSSTEAMASVAAGPKSISKVFEDLKEKKQCAFIPFICAGDPDLATTEKALRILDEVGADVIELGVPYSDPLADGPTIQEAATRALARGTTLDKVLELCARVAPTLKAPIVLFCYINPILSRGYEPFVQRVAASGVKGLLVPDIPLEETYAISAITKEYGVDLVLLSTPTTEQNRAVEIAKSTQGFLYLVSVTGVTGVRTNVSTRVEGLIKQLQGVTDKPVCVGFGVSKAEHAAEIEAWGAEGCIAGSALVRALGEAATPEEGLKNLEKIARELKGALPARA
eukprot:CAMPEP_0198207032 /NCGR_PEP_ID=MMETSP1445-20131203/10527_1 /TAXON_ID=36898 /ORGANISM="Pyramimonas sp., Strain CCMP2087" /LENGTH=291 /DNA_ID=CAMNT_0043879927 /DNA_START=252 /DNA_END=1127 /DNA_ORIENTATION=-